MSLKKSSAILVSALSLSLCQYAISAEDKLSTKVAILEFQNKAEAIIAVNRWTMAEDLGKHLRKANKSVELVKKKEILKVLGDSELSWAGERLDQTQERLLAESGVKYLVYGIITQWRTTSAAPGEQPELVREGSEASVVFGIEVVDATTGKLLKLFSTEGTATAIRTRPPGEEAFDYDENTSEDTLYDARDIALRKASAMISELLSSN